MICPPWTAGSFRARHWRKAGAGEARKAADIANAMMADDSFDGNEGRAIATAIKQARRLGRKRKRGACGGTPRMDGSGGGAGNRGTSRQPGR